jgi:putative transposase
MTHDPTAHHRRSIRLPDYDYTFPGAYFITICTYGKQCILSEVKSGEVILTDLGRDIDFRWKVLPEWFKNVSLDAHILMPNHLHGIIILTDELECRGKATANQYPFDPSFSAEVALPKTRPTEHPGARSGSLPAVIQNFKSTTSRCTKHIRGAIPLWQRNYYEHVIRNDRSLDEIREYIASNPWNWTKDEYYG